MDVNTAIVVLVIREIIVEIAFASEKHKVIPSTNDKLHESIMMVMENQSYLFLYSI